VGAISRCLPLIEVLIPVLLIPVVSQYVARFQ
jgi:hypothetical protein